MTLKLFTHTLLYFCEDNRRWVDNFFPIFIQLCYLYCDVDCALMTSTLRDSHFSTYKGLIYSRYMYQSFNSDICIFPLLPDCVYKWICFWVELKAKSNLWGTHINRQIQITEGLHAHTTQIYPDDKIWCGWHCLQWKIIGMSQHVSGIIMNDVQKRKVTAEDRGIM